MQPKRNKKTQNNYDPFNVPVEPKFRTTEKKYSDTFVAHTQIFAQLPLKILSFLGLNCLFSMGTDKVVSE